MIRFNVMEEGYLIRYGEIGTKSRQVKNRLINTLENRIEEKLEFENIDYKTVRKVPGRIYISTNHSKSLENKLSNLPGISSLSPVYQTDSEIKKIKEIVDNDISVGRTFGVDSKVVAEDFKFDSMGLNEEIGSYVDRNNESVVDLDNPDTWIYIEVREDDAFIYSSKIDGVDGLPAGSEGKFLALLSGGHDSPVACFEMLKRGADIKPIYFFNKPISAGDHLLRFEKTLEKISEFHPEKKWSYYVVDMEEINERLLSEVDRGRMIVHRRLMFRIAEELCKEDSLDGLVTGESLSQKSSQTASNLDITSSVVDDKSIFRPLLSWNKTDIIDRAREINTFEVSSINSACKDMSPNNPVTRMSEDKLNSIERNVDFEELVEIGLESVEEKTL